MNLRSSIFRGNRFRPTSIVIALAFAFSANADEVSRLLTVLPGSGSITLDGTVNVGGTDFDIQEQFPGSLTSPIVSGSILIEANVDPSGIPLGVKFIGGSPVDLAPQSQLVGPGSAPADLGGGIGTPTFLVAAIRDSTFSPRTVGPSLPVSNGEFDASQVTLQLFGTFAYGFGSGPSAGTVGTFTDATVQPNLVTDPGQLLNVGTTDSPRYALIMPIHFQSLLAAAPLATGVTDYRGSFAALELDGLQGGTWLGFQGGDLGDSNKWLGGTPNASTVARFEGIATEYVTTLDTQQTVGSVQVNGAAPTIHLFDGQLNVASSLSVQNGSTLNLTGKGSILADDADVGGGSVTIIKGNQNCGGACAAEPVGTPLLKVEAGTLTLGGNSSTFVSTYGALEVDQWISLGEGSLLASYRLSTVGAAGEIEPGQILVGTGTITGGPIGPNPPFLPNPVFPDPRSIYVSEGGALFGRGTYGGDVLVAGGIISPGTETDLSSLGPFNPGILSFTGGRLLFEDGTARFEIGGHTPGTEMDQIRSVQVGSFGSGFFGARGGPLSGFGNIIIDFKNGFIPSAGDSFVLFDDFLGPGVQANTLAIGGLPSHLRARWSGRSLFIREQVNVENLSLASGESTSIAGGDFTNSAVIDVESGASFAVDGNYIQVAGSTTVDGELVADTVRLEAGELTGSGVIGSDLFNLSGTVSPGSSPGILEVQGSFIQDGLGTTLFEIAGLIPGSEYDQILVDGDLDLSGLLDIRFLDGYLPNVGDRFDLLLVGGSFIDRGYSVQFTGVPTNFEYELGFDNGSLALTVTAVPEASSFVLAAVGLLGVLGLRRWRTTTAR